MINIQKYKNLISIFNTPDFNFVDSTHTYTYKGEKFPSVTGIIEEFHVPFDSEYQLKVKSEQLGITPEELQAEWDAKAKYACDLGSEVHEWIEDYYNKKWRELPVDKDRMNRIKKFLDIYVSRLHKLVPLAMELRIWSTVWKIAGTIDALFLHENENGKVSLIVGDWKTNKEFSHDDHENGRYKKLLSPFEDYYDNKHNAYSLQISIYRLMLAEHGIETHDGFLCHLGPDDQPPRLYKARDFRKELKQYLDENYK